MADIHLKFVDGGIEMYRTVRSLSGTRVRSKGKKVRLLGKSGIRAALPIFQPEEVVEGLSGESNDSR